VRSECVHIAHARHAADPPKEICDSTSQIPNHCTHCNQIQAQAQEVAKKAEAAAAARAAAVQGLGCMVDEPRKVWQAAVDLVKRYIPAANAYVANIVEEEETDLASGGEDEAAAAQEELGGGAESDDGGSGDAGAVAATGAQMLLSILTAGSARRAKEGAEDGAEEGGAAALQDEGADGDDDGSGAAQAVQRPDYSNRILSYVAASAGQEFMTRLELRRQPDNSTAQAADGSGEGSGGEGSGGDGGGSARDPAWAAAAAPVTFRVLDEYLPLVEVPAVSLEPRIRFLNPKGLPKIGGYVAAAAPAQPPAGSGAGAETQPASSNPLATGFYHCILAADTLHPEGSAQAFTSDEVAFLSDVACALGKALDAGESARRRDAAAAAGLLAAAPPAVAEGAGGDSSAEAAAPTTTPPLAAGAAGVAALRQAIEELYAAAPAPAPVPEVGEEPAAAAEAAAAGEDGAGAAQDQTPEELIESAEGVISYLEGAIAVSKVAVSNAEGALGTEVRALDAIKQSIAGVRGVALRALRMLPASPPATFHVLRAALLLLGREAAALRTWREASGQLGLRMFDDLLQFDAQAAVSPALWQRCVCIATRWGGQI